MIAYYTVRPRHGSPATSLTLVACHPLTGRTHQIRVHMTYAKHPLVGDAIYRTSRQAQVYSPRQFLHAERIRFRLPSGDAEVEFHAPLPPDLQAVLDALQPDGEQHAAGN